MPVHSHCGAETAGTVSLPSSKNGKPAPREPAVLTARLTQTFLRHEPESKWFYPPNREDVHLTRAPHSERRGATPFPECEARPLCRNPCGESTPRCSREREQMIMFSRMWTRRTCPAPISKTSARA